MFETKTIKEEYNYPLTPEQKKKYHYDLLPTDIDFEEGVVLSVKEAEQIFRKYGAWLMLEGQDDLSADLCDLELVSEALGKIMNIYDKRPELEYIFIQYHQMGAYVISEAKIGDPLSF